MRISDTYKGFVYQQDCAFLLLLQELADRTNVVAFRMEHPQGDDFDLVYPEELKVFQTKDVASPDMVDYLAKMWRRYTENMRPEEPRPITLGFVFSQEHNEPSLSALVAGKVDDPLLTGIMKTINDNRLTKTPVRTRAEWEEFLRPITVTVIKEGDIKKEIPRYLNLMFIAYELPPHQIQCLWDEFRGKLQDIMAEGSEVSAKFVRELIRNWFVLHAGQHPLISERQAKIFEEAMSNCMRRDVLPETAISGNGMV